MLLADLAAASRDVAATSARTGKITRLAQALRRAEPDEVEVAACYLTGELRQRRTGLGYASLRDRPAPASTPTLRVAAVDATFERIAAASGPGSATERRRLLAELMSAATEDEQPFLAGLVAGELRQGALEGVMVEAVARAAEVPATDVRRAVMLAGALPPVARAALSDGVAGLAEFSLVVGRPVQPMLAKTAPSVEAALETLGRAAVEWKLDGIRVQVHRDGDDIAVFTRSLDDVTARLPEVVATVAALPVRSIIIDGEAIALRDDGRPRPFQETAGRAMSHAPTALGLTPYVFDLLHLDGDDLMTRSGEDRYAAGSAVLPAEIRVRRIVTADAAEAREFYDTTVAAGHEGVVVKSLTTPYEAGRRGAGWLKVKPVHTLDLVVLGVEWGSGRRRGWLSNLHLGARDAESGEFVMLGKTFKGMTDEMLAWQTEHFLELETHREGHVVHVRPEQVVEIAFDGVQRSSRYAGGVALRFARVVRYRDDKSADQADEIGALQALL